jgi:hypothetical protein
MPKAFKRGANDEGKDDACETAACPHNAKGNAFAFDEPAVKEDTRWRSAMAVSRRYGRLAYTTGA